jgi:hypothetical protein
MLGKNSRMDANDANAITPEMLAKMEEAARIAMSNVRDPEAMRQAAEEMDRIREEIFKKHGILDIGVPAIRELRDGVEE